MIATIQYLTCGKKTLINKKISYFLLLSFSTGVITEFQYSTVELIDPVIPDILLWDKMFEKAKDVISLFLWAHTDTLDSPFDFTFCCCCQLTISQFYPP